jgi:Ca2+/Na+ antiporter
MISQLVPENLNEKLDPDYAMYYEALKRSNQWDKENNISSSFTIVCKDTITSNNSAQTLYDILERAIDLSKGIDLFSNPPILPLEGEEEKESNFDLLWMAVHMDDCDHYTNVRDLNETGMKLVDTIEPNGVLCILFTPEGKQKFLSIFDDKVNPIKKGTVTAPRSLGKELNSRINNNKNEKDKFRAVTPFPSLVDFNIFARGDNRELIRTVRCKDSTKSKNMNLNANKTTGTIDSLNSKPIKVEDQNKQQKNNNVSMSFFWFIVVIIIILFIAYFLIKFTAKKNEIPVYTPYG